MLGMIRTIKYGERHTSDNGDCFSGSAKRALNEIIFIH